MSNAWKIAPAIVAAWAIGVSEARAAVEPRPPAIPDPAAVVYLGKGLPLPVWATAVAMPRREDPPTSANTGELCSVNRGDANKKCTTAAASDGPRCSTSGSGFCSTLSSSSAVCSAFLMDTKCSAFSQFGTCSILSGEENRCSVMNVKQNDPPVGGRMCSTNAGSSDAVCSVFMDPNGFCSTGQGSVESSCSVHGGTKNFCSIYLASTTATSKCSVQNNVIGKCSVLVEGDGTCSVRVQDKGECTAIGNKNGMCSTFQNKEKVKCSVIKGKEVEGPQGGKCKGRG